MPESNFTPEQAAVEYTNKSDGKLGRDTSAQREHNAFLAGIAWARANPPPSDPLDKLSTAIAGLKP